ncbi:MAG: TIGR01212 family radical SAM protein [Lachnospiraceae bacterium]|nr:TIGR01212 family radical SAM protein [Lachnospiraceae bacterium]
MKIITLNDHLKSIYGTKVYKLSLSSGCTCPNRDGKLSYGGCTFCSAMGSGDFILNGIPLQQVPNVTQTTPLLPNASMLHAEYIQPDTHEQLEYAKKLVASKISANIPESERKYIAYFQSFSGTYGDNDHLRKIYTEAISDDSVVTLSIGTRPDCISDECLDLLMELNKIKPVWIELGLQTIHENTALRINRCYPLDVFEDTYSRLKAAGITVIVHMILGLPGESHEDMYASMRYLAELSPSLDGIKLHLLHILKGTKLAEEYAAAPFHIMSLEEYIEVVVNCLTILPDETVIHRMTGDGPRRLLIEPLWSLDKKNVLNRLNKAIREH